MPSRGMRSSALSFWRVRTSWLAVLIRSWFVVADCPAEAREAGWCLVVSGVGTEERCSCTVASTTERCWYAALMKPERVAVCGVATLAPWLLGIGKVVASLVMMTVNRVFHYLTDGNALWIHDTSHMD
jgi:hypothetical protein